MHKRDKYCRMLSLSQKGVKLFSSHLKCLYLAISKITLQVTGNWSQPKTQHNNSSTVFWQCIWGHGRSISPHLYLTLTSVFLTAFIIFFFFCVLYLSHFQSLVCIHHDSFPTLSPSFFSHQVALAIFLQNSSYTRKQWNMRK